MPTVKMQYSGYWQSSAGSKDHFTWQVEEGTECCGIWNLQIKGTSRDQFGSATVSGSCAEGKCNFEQVYTQGKFKGRTYRYEGTVELAADGDSLKRVHGTYLHQGGTATGKFVMDKFTKAK